MRGKVESFTIDYEGKQRLTILLSADGRAEYEGIKDKEDLVIDIKPYHKRRSLDANAALWKMLSKMADVLHTNKDELYLEVLSRYGVFTHIVVKPHMVERVKREWRTVKELGEVTINGQTGIQLQCYFGSSTLDSKEFSVLLDGVIQEAKEIGIDFISKEDQTRMIDEWRKSK